MRIRSRKIIFQGLIGSITLMSAWQASAVKSSRVRFHKFPITPHVNKQVLFWEGIFNKYPSTTVLIHDTNHPDVVIDLIDFTAFAKKYGKPLLTDRKKRDHITQNYIDRYLLGVKRFRKLGRKALKRGAIEQRLFNVYRRNRRAFVDLFKGKVDIRSQTGLSDEFKRAAKRAQIYLPRMEKIFREEGTPVELTRMAFVESMFNLDARSKVGASGIWQFMPATARKYSMFVNRYIDERNSPFKATRAAARLLRDNYESLRSWPLAITAYNHGRAGMSQAAKAVGSLNFDRIIANYQSRSFGFASKNFYAEFIAAKNVYDQHHKAKLPPAENKFDPIAINFEKKLSLYQLLRYTPLSEKILATYNPCLQKRAYESYRYRPLPKNYQLYVPKPLVKPIHLAIKKIKAPKYASRR